MADFLCVYNPTEETVATRIQGNWFTFAPGAIKTMEASRGEFVAMHRKETGLVVVRDTRFIAGLESYEPGFEKTEEGKKILAPLKEEGISNLINALMDKIRNNQVSLRQDLAHKYPSGDAAKLAALHASDAEIEAMRLVKKYKARNKDNDARKVDEVEKLMTEIGPFVQ
jgi:hypothetical protein